MRKTPTPPMHPTRICRGKKPIMTPRRRYPSRKNVIPVRIEDKANAAIVVDTIWAVFSSPSSLVISAARM